MSRRTNDLKGDYARAFSSVQSLSQVWVCDPMDCSTPGLPVHHQLPEFTQTHIHWVGEAIQPSHHLLSPSPPTFNLSQHQGLFKLWFSSDICLGVRLQDCMVALFLVFCGTSILSFRRRQWHPTPVLLPGKSHQWRSLVGFSPWGR